MRPSFYVQGPGGTSLLIDTTPDFRMQALGCPVERIDGVLITHTHADHIFGFDDLRRYFYIQHAPIDVYGSPKAIAEMNRIFAYVHLPRPEGTSILRVNFHEVKAPFEVKDLRVTPLPVMHGSWRIYGYRIDDEAGASVAYIPDCNEIPESTRALLQGVGAVALDGLRYRPHPTHFTVDEAVAELAMLEVPRGYLTHVCHEIEHETLAAALPDGVELAYDGLVFDV
jgi:phosphoribosyl 1,2-cyclic phosphate phosphodiesterase